MSLTQRLVRKGRSLVDRVRGRQKPSEILHRPTIQTPQLTLGTEYGGHTVATSGLGPDSVIYSFGIGEDVSFDLAMIKTFGCEVFAFDPTPRSIVWVRNNVNEPRLHFEGIGIAAQTGCVQVKKPENPAYVSHSKIIGDPSADNVIDFEVERFSQICARLGHQTIDVLKMDIEGFEYEVLADILAGYDRPKQIAVEFHHNMYSFRSQDTLRAVDQLVTAGYDLFHVSAGGHEYSFIRR